MTTKMIPELKDAYSQEATGILLAYNQKIDDIRSQRLDAAGAPVQLTPEQSRKLLLDQRTQAAQEARAEAVAAYSLTTERHQGEIVERSGFLKERLFAVPGEAGAEALMRAATASDEQLEVLLDIGLRAGNESLSRATFVVAERQGRGDLMGHYFDEGDPAARDLYEEWSAAPSGEQLQRQRDSVEVFIAPASPDWLMPLPGQVGL